MLRPSIARKILRVRCARIACRHYYEYESRRPPDLPPLSDPSFDGVPPYSFPIYRAPIPAPISMKDEIDIASLPSDKYLEKGIKTRLTKKAIEDTPELTEEALRTFYRGLIESGRNEGQEEELKAIEAPERRLRLGKARREEILARVEVRLLESCSNGGPSSGSAGPQSTDVASTPAHHRLASVLALIASSIPVPTTSNFSAKGKEKAVKTAGDIPLGLLSKREWDALFEEFIVRKDARGAEAFLEVMKRHGVHTDTEYVDHILAIDAKAGHSADIARLGLQLSSSGSDLDVGHRNAFITSLLHASPPDTRSAVSHLREHERQRHPLPQSSYNLILSHLVLPTATSQPTSHTRALASDLFSHMRLVAHPTPSREIFTTMIKACSDTRDPQPERARDLWIEMTTEGEKVVPRREEYDAIIRALCMTQSNYLEAFELLRQMIARHQDAVLQPFEDEPDTTSSRFVPTNQTFTALLEGTKRAGDLERARWILSEAVRLVMSSEAQGEKRLNGPNGEILAGVFMTYASWRPRVKRGGLKVKEESGMVGADSDVNDGLRMDLLADMANAGALARPDPIYATLVSPQTGADAVREASVLFDRILQAASIPSDQHGSTEMPFRDVHLNTRLINSYLSVHLAHAPSIAAARDAWETTWQRIYEVRDSLEPNAWSYLHVLERCSTGARSRPNGDDRQDGLRWAKQVWVNFRHFVNTHTEGMINRTEVVESSPIRPVQISKDIVVLRRERWLLGLSERQIERCWKAMIRLSAQSNEVAVSLSLLNQFHTLYPPSAIVAGYIPLPKTDLSICMSSVGSVPEPDVPPHLLWKDLDVLHQKLVRDEDINGVARLKWIAKSYEGALMKRRRFRVKGVGVARERRRDQRMTMSRVGRSDGGESLGQGDPLEGNGLGPERLEGEVGEAYAIERMRALG